MAAAFTPDAGYTDQPRGVTVEGPQEFAGFLRQRGELYYDQVTMLVQPGAHARAVIRTFTGPTRRAR